MKYIIITISIVFCAGCAPFSEKPLTVTVVRDKAGRTYTIQGSAQDVVGAIDRIQDR
jgi:hypothetical protein